MALKAMPKAPIPTKVRVPGSGTGDDDTVKPRGSGESVKFERYGAEMFVSGALENWELTKTPLTVLVVLAPTDQRTFVLPEVSVL